jgi:hypothetical protein
VSPRPLPARLSGALICLWAALLSVEMPLASCAHVPRPAEVSDPTATRGLGLVAVPEGGELRVWLRNGHVEQGAYRGIGRQKPADYAARYDAWRAWHPAAGWPALGDSVRMTTVYGGTRTGVFEGFEWGAVRVRAGTGAGVVRFEDLRELRADLESPQLRSRTGAQPEITASTS